MLRLLNKLRRDERGNILIVTAAAMPLLLGSAGLAVDAIQWSLWKRQLQRAADSAAIAGVYERNAFDANHAEVTQAVKDDLALNEHLSDTALVPTVDISLPDDPAPDRQVNKVKVTLSYSRPLIFSSFFLDTPPTIQVKATAASVPGAGEYCVIALDRRNGTGITIAGSTNVDLGECGMIANASSPTLAFDHNGKGSTVTAGFIAAVGGTNASDSDRWNVDNYFPYSDPAADPYANLPSPERTNCEIFATIDEKEDVDFTAAGHDGKVVCIEQSLEIKKSLKLGAATYVISSSSDFRMSANNSSLTCDGCTIVLTNFGNAANTGNFRLNGGTIDLKAPTTDTTYKGIALYQDRRAVSDDTKENHVNGNNLTSIQGVMYMPSRALSYNGGGDLVEDQCMQMIARTVKFSGSSDFKMGSLCTDAGMTGHIGGGWLVRLIA